MMKNKQKKNKSVDRHIIKLYQWTHSTYCKLFLLFSFFLVYAISNFNKLIHYYFFFRKKRRKRRHLRVFFLRIKKIIRRKKTLNKNDKQLIKYKTTNN